MLTANNRARSLRMMPNHQQAQQMQAPAMGLFTQSFEKPQATWSDKLGLLGGKLMDMDGTLGSGNFAQAQGAYDRRVSEAQSAFDENRRQQMLQQLGQMPGVTDQQRTFLGMGIGVDDMARQAFTAPETPKPFTLGQGQQRFDAQGNIIASVDPKEADPRLPSGMWRNPETGQIEPVPGYVDMQTQIAAARGSNANNVQSTFTGQDGTQYIVRRDGSLEPLGVKARNPFQITDVGGVPTAIDRLTGQGTQVTSPEAVGTNRATIDTITANEGDRREAQKALPKAVADAELTIASIQNLLDSPGFKSRYGAASVIPAIPGTPMAETQALIDQVNGQVFLDAYASLRGAQAITDIEGKKATDAKTRLNNQGLSPEDARAAAEELMAIVQKGVERAKAQASGSYAPQGADAPVLKYNPETGEFE